MAEQVQYEVSLKDMVSQPLQKMEHHAGKLEGALHNIEHTGLHMMEALGISFAIFKGIDFIEKGVHKFHELHAAEAQVENTLANVGERAHMSGEEMLEAAKNMAKEIPKTTTEILNMEGALARFKINSKETFEKIIQLSADVSVAGKRDGTEVATALGMIFEKPEMAMRKLRQFDIMFSKDQREMIENLIATGQQAKATEILFQALAERGFAGAAKAAADADPLLRFNKLMGGLQTEVGEAATKFLKWLTPALEDFVKMLREHWEWLKKTADTIKSWAKDHEDSLTAIAVAVGVATAAWGAYTAVSKSAAIWSTVRAAYFVVETGVLYGLGVAAEFVNSVFIASPIGWVVSILALLSGAVTYAWKHFQIFREVIMGVWGAIKEFANFVYTGPMKVLKALGEILEGALTFNLAKIRQGFNDAKSVVLEGAMNISEAWERGMQKGTTSWNNDHPGRVSLIKPPDTRNKTDKSAFDIQHEISSGNKLGSKSSGSKATTINIRIGSLNNGGIHVHNTTVEMAAHKVKDIFVKTLLSSINDAQIVTGY